MNELVFMKELLERLNVSNVTFYRTIKPLKLKVNKKLKRRSGKQARKERYFTTDEVVLVTGLVRKRMNPTLTTPKKRANNIFNSWQRISKWQEQKGA